MHSKRVPLTKYLPKWQNYLHMSKKSCNFAAFLKNNIKKTNIYSFIKTI